MAFVSLAGILKRDLTNAIRFGRGAPKYAERIYVDPKRCVRAASLRRDDSGLVEHWLPRIRADIINSTELTKVKCCLDHWGGGVPWSRTGIYEEMERLIAERGVADGCANFEDVVRRYETLDLIFETVRKEGRLRTVAEVGSRAFREFGGILIHLGQGDEIFFGRGGAHRFAMALVLGLDHIPAQLGCVDPSALELAKSLRSPT